MNVHLRGNILAAVDLETTGIDPTRAEIVQIAIVPLTDNLRPDPSRRAFYTNLAPERPDLADATSTAIHRLDLAELAATAPSQYRGQELLCEWFYKLDLPRGRKLVPLAHNFVFENSFLRAWLGVSLMDELFHYHPRDSMLCALTLNDKAVWAGKKPPFESVSLTSMCRQLGVVNTKPHDALADALAEAGVYRILLENY